MQVNMHHFKKIKKNKKYLRESWLIVQAGAALSVTTSTNLVIERAIYSNKDVAMQNNIQSCEHV